MAGEIGYAVHTKSSLMVGLGETREELHEAFEALRDVDCDILTSASTCGRRSSTCRSSATTTPTNSPR